VSDDEGKRSFDRGQAMQVLQALLRQLQRQRRLPHAPPFPAPESADERGCVAISMDLTPELILEAYPQGMFPMVEPDGSFGWWSPDPRAVLELDSVHVSRRLARRARSGRYEVRIDTAFAGVIQACAERDETWISSEVIEAYTELHRQGIAHSVEAWEGERLVGGLYGVSLGGAFMAESMFHRETDAGKVALLALVERLRERDYLLCDIQYVTRATSVFEPLELPRERYLFRLQKALKLERSFS